MATKKTRLKAKVSVSLRQKEGKRGKSLYLDPYFNGKRQKPEFLGLYITPAKTAADKARNAEVMRAAEAIRAQRYADLLAGKIGGPTSRTKQTLLQWIEQFYEEREKKGIKSYFPIAAFKSVLEGIGEQGVKLCDVDKAFCKRFLGYLKNEYRDRHGMPLKSTSAKRYQDQFAAVLNAAVREELIPTTPMVKLSADEKIRPEKTQREALDVDELRALLATEPKTNARGRKTFAKVRDAFLFSVYTGLRYSDVKALEWENLHLDASRPYLSIKMKKTREHIKIDLVDDAIKHLPKRECEHATGKVFDLPTLATIEWYLHRWAEAAGISKNVTFHIARHTFATLLLTKGADLYVVSKLLGHSDIETTQIYAEVVDRRRSEAIDLLRNLF